MTEPTTAVRKSAMKIFQRLFPLTDNIRYDFHPDDEHFTFTDMETPANRASFTLTGTLLSEHVE